MSGGDGLQGEASKGRASGGGGAVFTLGDEDGLELGLVEDFNFMGKLPSDKGNKRTTKGADQVMRIVGRVNPCREEDNPMGERG